MYAFSRDFKPPELLPEFRQCDLRLTEPMATQPLFVSGNHPFQWAVSEPVVTQVERGADESRNALIQCLAQKRAVL